MGSGGESMRGEAHWEGIQDSLIMTELMEVCFIGERCRMSVLLIGRS